MKSQAYPPGFAKQEKLALRKFCKKFEYDQQNDSLFYMDKQKDGSTLKRLVIKEDEKSRMFEECHSADFFLPCWQRQHAQEGQAALLLGHPTTGRIITRIRLKW